MNDHDLLIQIKVTLDLLNKLFSEHLSLSEKSHALFDVRLQAIEKWRWSWIGAISVLVILVNVVMRLIIR